MKLKTILNEVNRLPNVKQVLQDMKNLETSLLGWNKNVQIQDEVNDLIDAMYKLKERLR